MEIYRQISEEIAEDDPDTPKLVLGGVHSSSLTGREEVLRGSLVLDEKLHYARARRNQSDSLSYASSKQRSNTSVKKSKCCNSK